MFFCIEIKKLKSFLFWVIKMPSKSPYSEEMVDMTEKQKSEITRMRENGTAYNNISNLLGISINTVKSYCRRNNIKPLDKTIATEDICLNCGKAITQHKKVKKRKFCCLECKTEWWNSHPEAVRRKANYKLRCNSCGKDFISYGNKNRKYCSHECYINARFKGIKCDR